MAFLAFLVKNVANAPFSGAPATVGAVQLIAKDAGSWTFCGDLAVLTANVDPKPAIRPGNVPGVSHNLIMWQTPATPDGAALKAAKRSDARTCDGLDDQILNGYTRQRAADARRRDHVEPTFGGTRAMILNFDPAATTAFDFEVQADTLAGEKQSSGPETLQR